MGDVAAMVDDVNLPGDNVTRRRVLTLTEYAISADENPFPCQKTATANSELLSQTAQSFQAITSPWTPPAAKTLSNPIVLTTPAA